MQQYDEWLMPVEHIRFMELLLAIRKFIRSLNVSDRTYYQIANMESHPRRVSGDLLNIRLYPPHVV